MLAFRNGFTYDEPIQTVFLCGSAFSPKNERDKRLLLKKYIEDNHSKYRAIILEENFSFKSNTKKYLPYDDIYLKGLAQVEQLASLYANKIIIIHETISTAAELGMFAINSSLAKKLCLLVPDDYSVDGDTIGNFIRLAFLNENDLTTRVNLIRYYPDTEINRVSEFKSGYHTFFHEDQIGNNLDNAISCFLANDDEQKVVRFINNPYGKPLKKSGNISYHSYNHEKTVSVFIHVDALKPQLLALLFNSEVYSEIRKDKRIFEHVNYLERVYSSILKTTLEFLDGKDYKDYRLQIHLTDTDCNLKQAIGYYLYLLQAAGLLSLVQVNRTDRSLRRIAFSNMLISYKSEFSDYITTVKTTEFGGAFQ